MELRRMRWMSWAVLCAFITSSVTPAFALRPVGLEEQPQKNKDQIVSRLTDGTPAAGVFPGGNIPGSAAPRSIRPRLPAGAGLEENIQLTEEWLDKVMDEIGGGKIRHVKQGDADLAGPHLTRKEIERAVRNVADENGGWFRQRRSRTTLSILPPEPVKDEEKIPAHRELRYDLHSNQHVIDEITENAKLGRVVEVVYTVEGQERRLTGEGAEDPGKVKEAVEAASVGGRVLFARNARTKTDYLLPPGHTGPDADPQRAGLEERIETILLVGSGEAEVERVREIVEDVFPDADIQQAGLPLPSGIKLDGIDVAILAEFDEDAKDALADAYNNGQISHVIAPDHWDEQLPDYELRETLEGFRDAAGLEETGITRRQLLQAAAAAGGAALLPDIAAGAKPARQVEDKPVSGARVTFGGQKIVLAGLPEELVKGRGAALVLIENDNQGEPRVWYFQPKEPSGDWHFAVKEGTVTVSTGQVGKRAFREGHVWIFLLKDGKSVEALREKVKKLPNHTGEEPDSYVVQSPGRPDLATLLSDKEFVEKTGLTAIRVDKDSKAVQLLPKSGLEELTVVAADGMDESLLGTPGLVDLSSLKKGAEKIEAIVEAFRAAPTGGILIVRSATVVDEALIDQLPNLKGVIRAGHGRDNVRSAYLESKGILFRVTEGSDPEVGALAAAMVARAQANQIQAPVPDRAEAPPQFLPVSDWEAAYQEKAGKEPADLQPLLRSKFDALFQPIGQPTLDALKGKTQGVIGFGSVGKAIAAAAQKRSMEVLAYAPSLEADPTPAEAMGVQPASREEIERTSHYVVLATGLYKEGPRKNVGMVDAAAVDRMLQNPNLIALINPDREGLVVEEEIVRLMREGGIQYLADEVPRHPYLREHALFTPHIGASAPSAKARVAANTATVLREMREEIQRAGVEERTAEEVRAKYGSDIYAVGLRIGGNNVSAGLVNSKAQVDTRLIEEVKWRAIPEVLEYLGLDRSQAHSDEEINDAVLKLVPVPERGVVLDDDQKARARRIADRITEEAIDQAVRLVQEPGLPPQGLKVIHVAVPSPVNTERGTVGDPYPAPNVPGFDHYALVGKMREGIRQRLGAEVEVIVENDAPSGYKGEKFGGAGAGFTRIATFIWGTGMNGSDYAGRWFELGHALVGKKGADGKWHYRLAGAEKERPPLADGELELEQRLGGGSGLPAHWLTPNGFSSPQEVTERAKRGDRRAIRFLKEAGEEFGRAVAPVFARDYAETGSVLEQFILVSGIGENFGKGVTDDQGRDLLIGAIRDGAREELTGPLGVPPRVAREMVEAIARSDWNADREIAAAAEYLQQSAGLEEAAVGPRVEAPSRAEQAVGYVVDAGVGLLRSRMKLETPYLVVADGLRQTEALLDAGVPAERIVALIRDRSEEQQLVDDRGFRGDNILRADEFPDRESALRYAWRVAGMWLSNLEGVETTELRTTARTVRGLLAQLQELLPLEWQDDLQPVTADQAEQILRLYQLGV